MAVAVAALFCLHFSAPAYGFGLRAAGPRGPAAWQAGAEEAHESGRASWYGTPEDGFAYRTTACGETMDPDAWTCAHRSLPFGTIVLVENLLNGRTAMLRVNDRGPYVGGRIIDLSRRGADELGILRLGVVPVRIRPVGGVLKGHVTRAARAWRGSPPGAPFAAGGASARGLWPAPARRPPEVRPRAAADFRRAPSAPRDGGARAGGPGAGA
jgi:rare lipoprotein A